MSEKKESTTGGSGDQGGIERHLLLGGGTPGPMLVRGKGVRVWDDAGHSYLDCTSQSWALYLGHCHPEINAAISAQLEEMGHIHQGFHTRNRYAFAAKLAQLAPPKLNRVSFTVGGGPAIEAAMKIAVRNNPAASEFISLWDGYHGTTLGTMGASWISTRARGSFSGGSFYTSLTRNFTRVPNPYCYRCPLGQTPGQCKLDCAHVLRKTLERGINGPCAGVIMEPLQASGGQIPFPKAYLQEVRAICDEFKVPLIFDEIQTYMRIGSYYAANYYGVEPDIICLGKALGAGLPIAAIIIADHLRGFGPEVEELHTFANNQVSQAAGLKLIEIIQRDDVLENANTQGAWFAAQLRELQKRYPEIGDIRQVGMHIGVEFVADPETKRPLDDETPKIRQEGIARGALFGLGGVRRNVLKIKPPLIITRREAEEVMAIVADSVAVVLGRRA
ncbi:MAG: aminotransferase class III-fold pyridoxal phosphate-dependent enzyme [Armatimonadetes bacterium]|nr:aminotransferase class III-fold pyridoxal phosphate-dependent enzyme [Armatimonadota bacterium]